MTTVHIASPVHPEDIVPPLSIKGATVVPDNLSVDDTKALFVNDGLAIAAALWDSLPGGTLDVLTGELLARRASQFRVRFPKTTQVAP